MKNEEKFKDPSERQDAFEEYCKASIKECDGDEPCGQCQHYNFSNRTTCILNWLSDEYKDPDLPFKVMTDVACLRVVDAKTGDIVCDAVSIPQAEVVCERMNAAAMDWHKRMVEKEAE